MSVNRDDEEAVHDGPLGLGGVPEADAPSRRPRPRFLSLLGEFFRMSRTTALLLVVFVVVGAVYLAVRAEPVIQLRTPQPAVPTEPAPATPTDEVDPDEATEPTTSEEPTTPDETAPPSTPTTTTADDDTTDSPAQGRTPETRMTVPEGAATGEEPPAGADAPGAEGEAGAGVGGAGTDATVPDAE